MFLYQSYATTQTPGGVETSKSEEAAMPIAKTTKMQYQDARKLVTSVRKAKVKNVPSNLALAKRVCCQNGDLFELI